MRTVKYYVASITGRSLTHIWSAAARLDNARFDLAYYKAQFPNTHIVKADSRGWPTTELLSPRKRSGRRAS